MNRSKALRISALHSLSQQPRRRAVDGSPPYRRPRLLNHGSLGPLIRGSSWKGTDSIGELDPEQNYPG